MSRHENWRVLYFRLREENRMLKDKIEELEDKIEEYEEGISSIFGGGK